MTRPRVVDAVEKALPWTSGLLSAVALFGIMWLTLVDVLGRKFASRSVPGGLEITEILMVIVIFGALPLVSWRGEHVVFDSLDRWIPDRMKTLQARFVHLVCAAMFGLMAYLLVLRGQRFAEYSEVTVHLQLPMGPVAWLMAALLLVTALVHVVLMIWPPRAAAAHAPGEGHAA